MPGPFPISINSIALFYLLPFISVGVYTIGTQKFSLANFLLLLGGITALHSARLIYEKSVTGYIFWILAWAVMLYASYWNNQHEKPIKQKTKCLSLLSALSIEIHFRIKLKTQTKHVPSLHSLSHF